MLARTRRDGTVHPTGLPTRTAVEPDRADEFGSLAMAARNDEALTSGVLHGIEIGVAGGLITPGEVLAETPSLSQLVQQALDFAARVVDVLDVDMPSWRQALTGEIVGLAVAARLLAENLEDLTVEEMRETMEVIFKKIDRHDDYS